VHNQQPQLISIRAGLSGSQPFSLLIPKGLVLMRAKILVGLQTVFLGLGLLVLTPSANPTTGAAGNPQKVEMSLQDSVKFEVPQTTSSKHAAKPLAVWQCITGWYGEDFDGQQTANGETYDMYGITAAHPTLPLGSIVRVVNTRNHRSQIVRINDRGPYVEGRELDVSYEVARRLGFDEKGLAKVRVELLEVPSRPVSEHHN
jgi:rare lipoprotein A (peptidoglycan hydrolase)